MKPKLEYFGPFGRADPIRFALNKAGIQFEDISVSQQEWANRKAANNAGEFGFLPTLTIEGKEYGQTGAILRMLGSKYGFYDQQNSYNIDSVIELFEEGNNCLGKLLFMHDEEMIKAEIGRQIEAVHKPALAFFEK